MSVVIDRRRFTVEEYHQMTESGILTREDRVELINGEIISMSPINSPHAGCVKRINALFTRILREQVVVSVQDPLVVNDFSEPEPDVMLLKHRDDFYADAHPRPTDVYLLIEVADSSLPIDREVKLPLYAQAQIPEVWIINLAERTIEGYRSPSEGRYQETWVATREQEVTLPHFSINAAVKDLIG